MVRVSSWRSNLRRFGSLALFGALIALFGKPALAQSKIVPDDTLKDESSQVRTDAVVKDNPAEIIEGGARRGANLFHSFSEFNVESGRGAYFSNPIEVDRIFSRVTGSNPSEILGTLGVSGNADLFLINPNGIIFGENARLDVGGSFLGSTASSILFEGVEFNTVEPETPPLLTVNVPIGLNFQNNPGSIINRSTASNVTGEVVGLEVNSGNDITLIGGEINFDTGHLTAKGGNIELISLSSAETISINADNQINLPENLVKADINLTNSADINVSGIGEGNIFINAQNLNLEFGELGSSSIQAGIQPNSISDNVRAGNININVDESILLNQSNIANQVAGAGAGNSGNINVNADSISLLNGSGISTSTLGVGNAGDINISVAGNLNVDGENLLGLPSGIASLVNIGAEGNAGGIKISANDITLTNGGQISATTLGEGNAGLVDITAIGNIVLDGGSSDSFSLRSSINSGVNVGGVGNAGGVSVTAKNLTLTNGGEVSATTLGQGNAGNVNINAQESIFIEGQIRGAGSGISANALNFDGNGGNIDVLTEQLTIKNQGRIEASNFDNSNFFSSGIGQPGNINIEADSVSLVNIARIDAATQSEVGESGIINLQIAKDITLRDGSLITAQAFNNANGGNLNIDARFVIASPNNNDLIASASEGSGGNISINAKSIFGIREDSLNDLTSDINASSEFGLSGTVEINTPDVDRDRDLVQLPDRPIETNIEQVCDRQDTRSSLIIKGSGGLPPSPEAALNSDAIDVDWVRRPSVNNDASESASVEPISTHAETIVEAQGWIVDKNEEIVLVADNANSQSWQNLPRCTSQSLHHPGNRHSLIASTKPQIDPVVRDRIDIERFEIDGNKAFNSEELAEVLAPFSKKPLSFAELLQARSAITAYYTEKGYITSGAYIPPQKLRDKVLKIQVVEGYLEDIEVKGNKRLDSDYFSQRINTAAGGALQREKLLAALQLLQQDPLTKSLSAELEAGTRPGASILTIDVTEADSFSTPLVLDNQRNPSVGSFRQQLAINEGNLFGFGDNLALAYSNTEGSDAFDGSYTLPFNARNGTLTLSGGLSASEVTEEPFNQLEILGDSHYYELSLRQPLKRTPTQEFAIGVTASRRNSDISSLLTEFDIPPSELSPGADEEGETRVSALRFFQEWISRSDRRVIAARSQFNLGLGIFDATVNDNAPDSKFFSWQGQAQWTRQLAPDTLFILRGGVQLTSTSLLSSEQFGLGGLSTVRGYRQDLLLRNSAAFASAEARLPILRLNRLDSVIQLAPFFDVGTAEEKDDTSSEPNTLASVGLGLRFLISNITARVDWGIPLISVSSEKKSWQENGLYFSVEYSPF